MIPCGIATPSRLLPHFSSVTRGRLFFNMSKSNLLIDETPIVFQPTLAKLIGLPEAIVLQTLKFWCGQKRSGKVVDDERWIFNTLEQWREFSFPFWSTRTIGEVFRTLESMGLIKSQQFDLQAGKAMKYYTISQSALTLLTSERADHLEDSSTSIWKILPDHVEDSSRSARARHIKQYTEKQTEKQKPLTPLQGEEESSAVASHSSVELNQPNLFPTEITANAKVSFATAHFNDPPKMANAIRAGFKKNPPPRNIPTELDTPEFNTAWNEFLQHRKEKRAPMTPTAQKNMFGKFTAWGVESAVAAIDTAISNGWTGVFEPKENKSKSKPERFSNF
jgi:DNA-binding PadR family transcriptional regulator